MKKKKSGCLGCLGVLVVLGLVGAFLPGGKDDAKPEASASSSSSVVASSVADSSSQTETSSSTETVVASGEFAPQDSSDATIESIKTYNDYLTMLEFIINEYYANAEAAFEQYGLTDDGSFAAQRAATSQQLEADRQQYGAMGKMPLVGVKSGLVDVLKTYRDDLKVYTDALAQGATE